MTRRLGELRELRCPGELLMLMRLSAFAAAVPLLMRLPLPRVTSLLTRTSRRRSPRHPTPAEVERLDRLVTIAPRVAGPLVRAGCLTRGVTLFWFLRRAGLDVQLHFGLDPRDAHDTDGHCWLSLDGEPLLEKRDPRPRFAELYRLPLPAG